jgi:hypothetical protein
LTDTFLPARGGIMRKIVLVSLLLLCVAAAFAQQDSVIARADTAKHAEKITVAPKKNTEHINPYLAATLLQPIPLARVLFHDRIDKEQERADAIDGYTDNRITLPGDVASSLLYTNALIRDIDRMQIMVENMPANGRDTVMNNQQKIQSLRALWELMRQYHADPRPFPAFYSNLVHNMHDAILAANEFKSLDFTMDNPGIYTLDNGRVLLDNQPEARTFIYTYMGRQDPVMMIKRLEEFARDSFAADIIKAAARLEPKLVFNYTLSSNVLLKGAVYRTKDPFVQAIVQLTAESQAPLRGLPFVSYLYADAKTIEEIDSIAADPVLSYRHLTDLRISNEGLTRQLYTEALEYNALRDFARHMNALHDTTDEVRFRCIDSLPPAALYYIMVYGREELYTSSFLGAFRRMMERMAPVKGNELLSSLGYDHFRTFIRLCAGYNTLSEFLVSMDDTARTNVMSRFIGGLQNGPENELEDAVNVADAFGSIKDSVLFVFLNQKVKENYNRSVAEKNKKGIAIYSLLAKLIETNKVSASDTGAASASAKLKLPPINLVPFATLTNDTGTVFERVFFYGDEDGKTAYEGFIEDYYKNPKWKVDTTNRHWAVVTATTGRPVVMYANRPLKAPEDELAISSLDAYLSDNNIRPKIVVHRGHSYHVKTTLSKLDTNARIVVLGSCGGYHNVAAVLGRAPGAHIISSKQTGVGAINEPIIRAINTQLQDGADINWITTWTGLDEYFLKRKELYEKYSDYIPPHKNLGVIFIKAYKQLMSNAK